MDSSRLRYGIRALAFLAIGPGLAVGVATAAQAKDVIVKDSKSLKTSCDNGGGAFVAFPGGGACANDRYIVVCDDMKKGAKCEAARYPKGELALVDTVRAPNGVKLTTQAVPHSQMWKQKLDVPALRDVVCTSLGGEFVAPPDATFGACTTATATIVCKDGLPGTNCVGIADTKKQAKSIPKQIKTVVSGNAGGTSTTATATTETPPTTRCVGRRCPKPTIPPGTKAPQPSVSVAPPK